MWVVWNRTSNEMIPVDDCDLVFIDENPLPTHMNDNVLVDSIFCQALGECISWVDVEYSIEGSE